MKDNQAQDHRDMTYTEIVAKIDTKCTAIFTASTYRDQILKSGYMHQLYTYLRSQERDDDPASLTSEGMLLHPQTGGSVDEEITVQGHVMRFKTVDLMGDPRTFEANLRSLVSER